jgi:hypothetical protein
MQNATKELQSLPEELSRNASSSGRNIGLSVWSHKGPILKGIRIEPPRYATFVSWPKVRYFLDRVVQGKLKKFSLFLRSTP